MALAASAPLSAREVLTLESAFQRARERAPAVLAAHARIDEARARRIGAGARQRENPSFMAAAGPRDGPEGETVDVELGFEQLFETGGQRGARLSAAEAGIDRETASSEGVVQRLLGEVGAAFLRGLAARDRLSASTAGLEVATELRRATERRYELGDVAALELNLARIAAARARAVLQDVSAEKLSSEGRLREALGSIPGISVLFTTPLGMRIDEGLGGTPADLSVRIFGPDLDRLAELGRDAARILSEVEGIDDLRAEQLTGQPQIRVEVDRQAVARVGLTPGDVVSAVRIALAGAEPSEIWVGQRRFDLVVRLGDEARGSVSAIRSLLLHGHDGTRIPVAQLATVQEVFGPASIRREAGTRRVAVEAGVSGRDLGSTAEDARRTLAERLELPTGYFFDVAGRVESQDRARRSLTMAIGAAVAAVFLLLYLALGSAAETLVILATLPDAFVGGILALVLAGETWNVSSVVGLMGLFGIAVQNGLVLVAQTRALAADGRPFEDALREASIGRVRPKLLTAATAILGLLPLLLLPLHGTEIERPLAVVMVGGLVTSTAFTLLALPTFYLWVSKLREG
jgi:Cu/Ag efflux pump CusA